MNNKYKFTLKGTFEYYCETEYETTYEDAKREAFNFLSQDAEHFVKYNVTELEAEVKEFIGSKGEKKNDQKLKRTIYLQD